MLVYLGCLIVAGAFPVLPPTAAAQTTNLSANQPGAQLLASGTAPSPTDSPVSETSTLRTSLKSPVQLNATLNDLTKMLDQYRSNGNRHEQANVLCAMASLYRDLHEQQRSLESLNSALELWKSMGETVREAETLSDIGDLYREWGFPDRAVPFFRQSLLIFPKTKDEAGGAEAMNGLGIAYLALRDKKRSQEYFNRALALYRAQRNELGEARALSNLGAAYFSLVHDPMKAITTLQDALTRLEVLNDTANEANALEIIGMAWKSLGKPEMASTAFQRALVLFHQVGSAAGENSIRRQLDLLKEPSS